MKRQEAGPDGMRSSINGVDGDGRRRRHVLDRAAADCRSGTRAADSTQKNAKIGARQRSSSFLSNLMPLLSLFGVQLAPSHTQ